MKQEKAHFGAKVMEYFEAIEPGWELPDGVELLFPYDNPETMAAMRLFYSRYYSDARPRIFVFGINPGRFGAGITGVPFTDPIRLAEDCGIENAFQKKAELSSQFVYEVVHAYGGPEAFYRDIYITSVCPLGFTKDGKNYNYYDDRRLEKAVEPYIIDNIVRQKAIGALEETAVCLGEGQNYKYFTKINDEHGFFKTIVPLPHPRWVMQYRRRRMEEFKERYLIALTGISGQ